MADTPPTPRDPDAGYDSFGRKLKLGLERVLAGPKQAARSVARQSELLSDMYYAVVQRSFSREHRAVLHGIYTYQRLELAGAANRWLLRRNTHRLEKGLLMRPRRPVFALKYIEETIDAYERYLESWLASRGDDGELRWAHDVLAEYFAVCGPNELVDRMRERFAALPAIPEQPSPKSIPYKRQLEGPLPVDYDAFYKLAKRRRSVRWFLPKPVPRELVDKAILAAVEAPSACNRQPFQFRLYDDPEMVQKLIALPAGTKGWGPNAPIVVVLVGQLRAYFDPRDRHLPYIDGSLAAMGLMLALETVGLSSVPVNWPDVASREKKLAKLLDLEPDQRAIMFMAIGYPDPDGMVAFSHKQHLDRLRVWNSGVDA